jgi:mannose-6-phosphate isomerase-like protein (cupin superfamily)
MSEYVERKVPDFLPEEQERGTHDAWITPDFPKYWTMIVVKPDEATEMMSFGTGKKAEGEVQGIPHYHLVYPPTTNTLSIRMGWMELPPGPTARENGFFHWHAAEEIFYTIRGHGAMEYFIDGKVVRKEYGPGDGIFVPFGVKHGQVNLGDEPIEQIFAIGPRLRPYEDVTELSIDYREFEPLDA